MACEREIAKDERRIEMEIASVLDFTKVQPRQMLNRSPERSSVQIIRGVSAKPIRTDVERPAAKSAAT